MKLFFIFFFFAVCSALMVLVGWQEGHLACKKTEWWGTGMVICLERGADLHMALLVLLPLTVSCISKIQIGFTFLVPAHPGSPGQRAIKRVCVCVFFFAVVCCDTRLHLLVSREKDDIISVWMKIICQLLAQSDPLKV